MVTQSKLKEYYGITPCSNGDCIFRVEPCKGMHTNGNCKCVRNKPHQTVRFITILKKGE